ncbi:MAG: hypothetical protein Fur0042_01870 [Cyanophyceae cyanobacterium]
MDKAAGGVQPKQSSALGVKAMVSQLVAMNTWGAIAAVMVGAAMVPPAIAETPTTLETYQQQQMNGGGAIAWADDLQPQGDNEDWGLACDAQNTLQTALVHGVPLGGLPCTVYTQYPELDGNVGGLGPIVLRVQSAATADATLLFAPGDIEQMVWQADAIAFEPDQGSAMVVYWTMPDDAVVAPMGATAIGQVVDRGDPAPRLAQSDNSSTVLFQAP